MWNYFFLNHCLSFIHSSLHQLNLRLENIVMLSRILGKLRDPPGTHLIASETGRTRPALAAQQRPAPKPAFSHTNRSKKVRDPELHAEGTECLQASRCALLLPEVSMG